MTQTGGTTEGTNAGGGIGAPAVGLMAETCGGRRLFDWKVASNSTVPPLFLTLKTWAVFPLDVTYSNF